mgnify:CR=1 FL=1
MTPEQRKERDKKIRERAKQLRKQHLFFNVKRLPGVGKEKTYMGTIPGKYKGKLLFDDEGTLYDTDMRDVAAGVILHGGGSIGTYRSAPNNPNIIKYEFYPGRGLQTPDDFGRQLNPDDKQVAEINIAQMRNMKDLPSIDPSTNVTDEIQKIMYSHGIRERPKPNPEQAEAIKNLRDINELSIKNTRTDLKGEVNKLMSSYGIR